MTTSLALPAGWAARHLGDIADFEMGQAPPGIACNKDGIGTLFVKAGEFGPIYPVQVEWTTQPLKYGRTGDVFICVVGATCGKLNLGIDCAIGRSVAAIRPNKALDSRFIYHQLQLQVLHLRANSSGSAQGVISRADLSQISIRLAPLPEQVRIIAKIEELFSDLDAGVAALERVRANLKRFRAAVLKAAVEGSLTGISKSIAHSPFAELIHGLSQGWSPKCDLMRSPFPDEWAIIKTTAVQHMRYDDSEGKPLPAALKPRPHLEIKAGDFLMTRKGPRVRAGVACLVRRTRPRLMVCDTVYRFRCREDLVHPEFLELVLSSPVIVAAINQKKAGISESGVSLTHEKVGEIAIPVPTLVQQKAIVAEVDRRLSVADAAETQVEHALHRAARLRQAILKRAFEGKLVPQDPTDDPLTTRIGSQVSGTSTVSLQGRVGPSRNISTPALWRR